MDARVMAICLLIDLKK